MSHGMQRKMGRLVRCLEVRGGCSEWEVEVEGRAERAVAFAELCGSLRPDQTVILNTTAEALSLGTGGAHFVIAPQDAGAETPFAGREAGHILKLRYTPLQHRVLAAEDEASPYHAAIGRFSSLEGTPVLAAELHSQAAAAAIAARAENPSLRIAWVQVDTAALPLRLSRLLDRLRSEGVVDATVSTGQAFGGEIETVNVYSGLMAARAVAAAGLILVTQGPGNVGTGTELGFSGISMAEALHAAAALGGSPILAPRMSEGDARQRHRGLSHHTRTLLRRCLHVPVELPLPRDWCERVREELAGSPMEHRMVSIDAEGLLDYLSGYDLILRTMGRTPVQDRLFFEAAAGAGSYAARRARDGGGS